MRVSELYIFFLGVLSL